MIVLLFTVSFPYLRAHMGRIGLTLLGVVLGVQGMVAMGALNHSIIRSFETGLEAVAGTAQIQIAGPETGIPDSLAEDALRIPGVESAVAMVDGSLTLPEDASFRIRAFGIDLLSMAGTRSPQFPRENVHIKDELTFVNATDSIALAQPLLDRLGLHVGDTLRLATPSGVRLFVIRGWLDNVGPTKLFGGLVALLDLPAAESLFLAPGLAQTIYISTNPAASLETVENALRKEIGERARLQRTEARGQQMDSLLGSIRVALSLASLVTMIAAFFIIYETIAISVEQRRREIAIARSLGFTRGAVAGVFILESLILGLLGAAGGVVGGYALARLSLTTAVAGISGMYFTVGSGTVTLPLNSTLVAIGTGCMVCMFAAAVPAMDAANDPPAQVLRGALGVRDKPPTLRSLVQSLFLIAIAICVLGVDPRLQSSGTKTAWIMAGHTLLLIGFGRLASHYVRGCASMLSPLATRAEFPTSLACEFFCHRPQRLAAAASAIMVGYALVVVLGSVVHSIEQTLSEWINVTLGADIKVGTGAGLNSGSFDSRVADQIRNLPQVLSVERYQKTLYIFEDQPVVLVAIDPKNRPNGQPLMVVRDTDDAYNKIDNGRGIAVSESFSLRYSYDLGDVLDLTTAVGKRPFPIVAVVRDYAMDLGTILVGIEPYQELWMDTRLTYAQVWPAPGADLEALRHSINAVVKDQPAVAVVTNREFRSDVEKRVHDLLGVLSSLQLFACSIAVLGVITFLLAAIADRRREIALLRSVGVTTGQIQGAIMIEGGLIGLSGATLGLMAGIPAAYFMVKHSMPVAMGWTLDFRFPVLLAATTLIAITLAAALAAYFPARRITRGTILAGLQTE